MGLERMPNAQVLIDRSAVIAAAPDDMGGRYYLRIHLAGGGSLHVPYADREARSRDAAWLMGATDWTAT